MLYDVSVFESVVPNFSVASTILEATPAEVVATKIAQSLKDTFSMNAADIALCPSLPELGSRKKFLVIAIRAIDLSSVSGTAAALATNS